MTIKMAILKQACLDLLIIFKQEGENFYAKKFENFLNLLVAVEQHDLSIENAWKIFQTEFRALHTPHGGLGSFYVWRDDFEERESINLEVKERLDIIWSELGL